MYNYQPPQPYRPSPPTPSVPGSSLTAVNASASGSSASSAGSRRYRFDVWLQRRKNYGRTGAHLYVHTWVTHLASPNDPPHAFSLSSTACKAIGGTLYKLHQTKAERHKGDPFRVYRVYGDNVWSTPTGTRPVFVEVSGLVPNTIESAPASSQWMARHPSSEGVTLTRIMQDLNTTGSQPGNSTPVPSRTTAGFPSISQHQSYPAAVSTSRRSIPGPAGTLSASGSSAASKAAKPTSYLASQQTRERQGYYKKHPVQREVSLQDVVYLRNNVYCYVPAKTLWDPRTFTSTELQHDGNNKIFERACASNKLETREGYACDSPLFLQWRKT